MNVLVLVLESLASSYLGLALEKKLLDQDQDFSSMTSIYCRFSVTIQRLNAALFHKTFTCHDDPDL